MSKSIKVTSSYIASAVEMLKRVKPVKLPASSTKRIVDTSQSTRILTNYPLEKLVGLLAHGVVKPHSRQRNHKRDLEQGRSSHVTKGVSLSHTELVLAYWNGAWDFTDGNHRARFWSEFKTGQAPAFVNLVLKFPSTEDEYIRLFFEYDSSQAHKNNTDHLEGILNHLGLLEQMQSPMFLDGKFWGAAWRLAGSTNLAEVLVAIKTHKSALMKLDQHRFRPSHLPMGGMLAAIELYHSEDELLVFEFLVKFREAYAAGVKKSLSGYSSASPEIEKLIDMLHSFSKEHGTRKPVSGYGLTGEDAVPYVQEATHQCFRAYKARRMNEMKALIKRSRKALAS